MLGFRMVVVISAFCVAYAETKNEEENLQALLTSFLSANRLDGRSVDVDQAVLEYCTEKVKELDEENGKDKGDDYIADCLAECLVHAGVPGFFDDDDFEDPECITDGLTVEESSREVISTRKWRPFQKIGSWFRKNKDKIIKGLKVAAAIIGGVVKAVGK